MRNWREKIVNFLGHPRQDADFRLLDEALTAYAAWSLPVGAPALLLVDSSKTASRLTAELGILATELRSPRRAVMLPELPPGKLLTLELEAEFSGVLFGVLESPPDFLVASAGALLEALPDPAQLAKSRFELIPTSGVTFSTLIGKLVELGYDDEFEVTTPGEFARRGGIVDVFSPAHGFPARLEFWGEELTNIRRFDPGTQRSEAKIDHYRVIARELPARDASGAATLADYVERLNLTPVLIHPERCRLQLKNFSAEDRAARFNRAWDRLPRRREWGGGDGPGNPEAFGCFPAVAHLVRLLPEEIMESSLEMVRSQIARQITQWLDSGYMVLLGGRDPDALRHIARWKEVYRQQHSRLETVGAEMPCGVIFPTLKLVFLNEKELFAVNLKQQARDGETRESHVPAFRRFELSEAVGIVADLNEGDPAVHLDYGIGIFRGLQTIAGRDGSRREVMVLEYADEKLLYVPPQNAHLVSRYLGAAGKVPLHHLNTKRWASDRAGALRAVREYAADLLRIQAVRRSIPNLPLPPEDYEQLAFENGAGFELTVDQRRAVDEVKGDLAGKHPMDRLLCGDVGFGKTEVAMVAAFRMVSAGFQVAVVAPTTVLAQQHFYSFSARFAEYPITIEMVSRFRSPAEQRETLRRAVAGRVDILIGTHRLFQSDVAFKNLGLVVIDEEQRFGVRHKDLLRRLRTEANVLSMSATPIPRTLYLAMAGARDLSTIMTAPLARLPVKTAICGEGDAAWVSAVNSELARGGQVFYLHNRVASIESCADKLRARFPHARIETAHGRMDEDALEKAMARFLSGKVDVLVCTTIIESGLDVTNANTIIIERADRFGLAELYQLRGRVGRGRQQAYACLMLPRGELMSLDGRKRIAAIRRYTHLGAGFQLALRDLEIRGSGNLLGEEQSGYVRAIGFDLYCRLLSGEIKRLKGENPEFLPEVELALDFAANAWETSSAQLAAALPPDYIESPRLRVEAYRKLARAASEPELTELRAELTDRYGRLPAPAQNMFKLHLVRVLAARKGYVSVSTGDGYVWFRTATGVPFKLGGKVPEMGEGLTPERMLGRVIELARML
ncbi:MAG: DEAD/DEAH box helicase [Victivallaceae bacterium]|nr:TRCF domain-containing protein [Victivallaceae bacterium]